MKYRNKAERLAIAAAWKRSGLTQVAFAEQQGLNVKSFRRWVQELLHVTRRPEAEALTFIEVESVEASPVRVVLPTGVVLEVPEDVVPARVRALVAALC